MTAGEHALATVLLARAEMKKLALTPEQIINDPRGLTRIANQMRHADISVAEAEYRIFRIAIAAGFDPEKAIELLHAEVSVLELAETRAFAEGRVRLAAIKSLQSGETPDQTRECAKEANAGTLSPDAVTAILREEYRSHRGR
jgi:hypothetical protein